MISSNPLVSTESIDNADETELSLNEEYGLEFIAIKDNDNNLISVTYNLTKWNNLFDFELFHLNNCELSYYVNIDSFLTIFAKNGLCSPLCLVKFCFFHQLLNHTLYE